MALDTDIFRKALIKYQSKRGRGAWAELARLSGVSSPVLSKVAKGENNVSLESWEKIYKAVPDEFPAPPTMRPWPPEDQDSIQDGPHGISGDALVKTRRVPVFDAGAGEPSHFTDGQHPIGHAMEYVVIPAKRTDANTFGVRIHGDSMFPYLNEKDIAIVVPSIEVEHGKLCFATWPGDAGRRLVKRYFKYGKTVVLKSDNPEHAEITLDESNAQGVRIYRVTMTLRQE